MSNKPVIVFSMEKAGSTTIMRALESAGYPAHRAYAENVDALPWRTSKIVVPFRDPFEHAISWAFEDHLMNNAKIPGFNQLSQFPALTWFDDHFEERFGFNPIDDAPGNFSKKRGVRIQWRDAGTILIIRTDKLSEILGDKLAWAFNKNIDGNTDGAFDVQHRARGADRFGVRYKEFATNFIIPHGIVNEIVHSDYVKAFWTDDERRKMVKQWIREK